MTLTDLDLLNAFILGLMIWEMPRSVQFRYQQQGRYPAARNLEKWLADFLPHKTAAYSKGHPQKHRFFVQQQFWADGFGHLEGWGWLAIDGLKAGINGALSGA